MAETYFPFDAGAGANTTEDGWAKMARLWLRTGVLRGELNGLAVTAPGSGMTVSVASGQAFIEGFFYENSSSKSITIATADATNARIDRIVARLDRTANTITAQVITGTPAASPSAPPALATSTQWDVTLATVLVGASVVIVASDKVTDLRPYASPVVDRLDLRSSVDAPSDVGLRRTGSGAAQIDGALTVTGALRSNGAATFDAAVSVSGPLGAFSTFHAVGAAQFDNLVAIAGALGVGGALHAVGAATLDSNLTVSGNGHVVGTMTVDGGANVGGALGVTGIISSSNKILAAASGTNSVSFGDNDAHTWESDGAGGWRFANRWGIAGATFRFYGGAALDELVRFADPPSTRSTSLNLFWKDASGVTRFQEVRTSASGELDGTIRRYLYVTEV